MFVECSSWCLHAFNCWISWAPLLSLFSIWREALQNYSYELTQEVECCYYMNVLYNKNVPVIAIKCQVSPCTEVNTSAPFLLCCFTVHADFHQQHCFIVYYLFHILLNNYMKWRLSFVILMKAMMIVLMMRAAG